MPNRILKDSICTSDNVDELSTFQETFFYRLIVNCDDYGRMDARAKILSARLFPLKNLDEDQIKDALRALVNADLIILYEVNGRPYLQMKTWERHQQVRARKSKYPSPDEGVCKQTEADGSNCLQMISDDSKCPRNPIQSESNPNPNPNRNTREDADYAEDFRIQEEHDQILNAAENAGFPRNNTVRAKLLDAYAQHGKEKVLHAIEQCALHSAASIAYLQAVLSDKPRSGQGKPAKTVIAQQYDQRDYSGQEESVDEMMERLMSINGQNAG